MALQNLTMLAIDVAEVAKSSRTAEITAAKTDVINTVKNTTVGEVVAAALDGAKVSDLATKSEVSAVQQQAETNASAIETINGDISDLQTAVGQKANANDVYTKTEVDNKLAAIPKFGVEVVSALPAVSEASADKVYLVRTSDLLGSDNIYTEYILVNGAFEELGTQKLDLSNYATKDDLTKYVLQSDIFTNGTFNTKYTGNDGSYATLFNESDGGGSQYFNKGADVLSYVGTNDGDEKATAIDVQIYSKVKTSNSGVRINVNPQKAYYTKGANTTANGGSEDNEIAVLADVKAASDAATAALEDYVKTEDAEATYAKATDVTTELAKKLTKSELINNSGAVYNKINGSDGGEGSFALLFNETDGGGSMYFHKADNVKAYMGVCGAGTNATAAQVYVFDDTSGVGSRMNFTDKGIFYTMGGRGQGNPAGREVAVKGDIPDVSSFVTQSDIDSSIASKADASDVYTKAEVDAAINAAIAGVLNQIRSELNGGE